MSDCGFSEHKVSAVVDGSVLVVVNFLLFRPLKPLHGFALNFAWMFFRWTPTKFASSIFNGIMVTFVQFLHNSF